MFRTLRSQLTALFLVISLVPLTIAIGVVWYTTRQSLTAELTKGLRSIAARQSAQMNTVISDRMKDAELLAEAPTVIRALQEMQPGAAQDTKIVRDLDDYLQFYRQGQDYANIYLVTRSGEVVYTALPCTERGQNLAEQRVATELSRVFDRANTILETELSDYRTHPSTGQPAAFVATPVLSNGRVLGILAFQMGPEVLLHGVRDYTGLGSTGETIVGIQDGPDVLLVSETRGNPEAAFNVRVPITEELIHPLERAVLAGRGAGFGIDYAGKEVFAVWRYLPSMRWGIVVKIDRAEAFAPVDRLGRLFVVILVLTVGAVVVTGFLTARRLAQPIGSLSDVTRRVAEGEFDVQIEVRSKNEIADLASNFREMTSHLKRTFTDLTRTTEERERAAQQALASAEEARAARLHVEEINATLEQRVEDRTRELRSKNAELESTLAQLQRSQQQLIAREKMASLGELTAGVAHEISNPLNFVKNFAELSLDLCGDLTDIGQRVSDPEKLELSELLPMLEENLSRIHEHGRRAQNIVKEMIEHSRLGSGDRQAANINWLVQEYSRAAVKSFYTRDQSVSEVSLDYQLDEKDPEVMLFAAEFSRALLNVVNNALWAVQERRKTAPLDFKPRVILQTRIINGTLQVSVRDNGIGIPPSSLSKIFQPFYTTKPSGLGTGLGLSIAWEIVVNQHGGKLEALSQVDQFTEIRMLLPTGS